MYATTPKDSEAFTFKKPKKRRIKGSQNNLIIKDNYRNQGLGKVLIRLILGTLEESITRIYLEVAANNEPALRLYRASGFTEIGRRRGYYSGDKLQSNAITMCLDV